jgi:hypothetical protein
MVVTPPHVGERPSWRWSVLLAVAGCTTVHVTSQVSDWGGGRFHLVEADVDRQHAVERAARYCRESRSGQKALVESFGEEAGHERPAYALVFSVYAPLGRRVSGRPPSSGV